MWYGVVVNNKGYVEALYLENNNLIGSLPTSIGNLKELIQMYLSDNTISGEMPSTIGNLINLKYLVLSNNQLSGQIPESIGNLTSLEYLDINNNQLSGSIPNTICHLSKLITLSLEENQLTGILPADLDKMSSLENLRLTNNQLEGTLPESMGYMPSLKYIQIDNNNFEGTFPVSFINLNGLIYVNVFNNRMNGVISASLIEAGVFDHMDYFYYEQQEGYKLTFEATYISTDFSKDGFVNVSQIHTKGHGIPLVIMGDAFSDRMIADGIYDRWMEQGMNDFFAIEPYATFKEYFDIYFVTTVSKNELIGQETALETQSGGSLYAININKVTDYVHRIEALNNSTTNVTTLVLLNEQMGGGRVNCSMFVDGFSIGLACVGYDDLKATINHETGGHGFGLLADEYWYDNDGAFPEEEKNNLRIDQSNGYSLNVDYENNPSKVIWANFINNPDYEVESIGVYEGGMGGYKTGIYRPTENSIMRSSHDNDAIFNAPSRWAIYKRIMELAGEAYSFDTFLEYDKKNLAAIAAKASTRNFVEKPTVSKVTHGAPPRIYNYPSSEIGRH